MTQVFIRIFCLFIPSKKGRHSLRKKFPQWVLFVKSFFIFSEEGKKVVLNGGSIVQFRRMKKRLLKEQERAFPNYLSVCAIAKNEAPYFKEWIEFHKLVGVEKFYIYDNESTDNIQEILEPYIHSGEVVYTYFPGKMRQIAAYNDALQKYKNETKWMAFIDLDEFILPLETETIPQFLKMYELQPALAVYWLVYGDNGHSTKTDGLIFERFKAHSEREFRANYHVKCLVNPREVVEMNIHGAVYQGGFALDENGEVVSDALGKRPSHSRIKINHYFGKSFEEFLRKRERGRAASLGKRDLDIFEEHNRNEIKGDTSADKYIPLLKEKLNIQ